MAIHDSPLGHSAKDVRQRHAAKSSPASNDTGTDTAPTLEEKLLLFWDDLPSWRRDNAYIVSGYRRSKASFFHPLLSLTHLHNESVNIWSHFLGSLAALLGSVYLYTVVHPRYESATDADVLVFACFFGGAVLCLGMSATFHALTSHSEEFSRWGNKLDYTGIVLLIVGSNVPVLYYGFFCHPRIMTFYLYLIAILGIGCGIVSWVDRFRSPAWRPYRAMMFIGLGLSGVVPVVHGIRIYGYQGLEERASVSFVVLQGALYIFGAVLYAVRWPERIAPGTFDIWGSSHQIFHVFVILAAVTHFYGMTKAFDYHHTIMGSQCLID